MFRIVIFAASLLCGTLAAWMTFAWQPAAAPMETSERTEAVAPATEVLVAAANLPQGVSLQASGMTWRDWPESGVTEDMIVKSLRPDAVEGLEGSIVRGGFVAGEPIRDGKLVAGDSGFMAAILAPGKRAAAVRISAENTAGGFILPNDMVDVIHTRQVASNDGGAANTVSRTILRNIRVLAIDQNTNGSGTEAVAVGKTATLELTPEQVETAATAESAGALSLALRPAHEVDEPEIAIATVPEPDPAPAQESVVTLIQSGISHQVTTRPSTRNQDVAGALVAQ